MKNILVFRDDFGIEEWAVLPLYTLMEANVVVEWLYECVCINRSKVQEVGCPNAHANLFVGTYSKVQNLGV